MKKHLLALCLSITALVTPSLSLASTSNGPVSAPLAIEQGVITFGVTDVGTFTGAKPACATVAAWNQWAVDVKTPGGRAIYATILQAHALGKSLLVQGKGVCDVWGDRESVNFVYISN
jgi:hypothetical protein